MKIGKRKRGKNIGLYQNGYSLSTTVPTATAMGKLGAVLAKNTTKRLWLLRGNLGAGKSTLIRGALRSLGVTSRIASPTFGLVHIYPLHQQHWSRVVHVDLYRLQDDRELDGIGWHELLHDQDSLVMVEWPERIKKIGRVAALQISIHHRGQQRVVSVK